MLSKVKQRGKAKYDGSSSSAFITIRKCGVRRRTNKDRLGIVILYYIFNCCILVQIWPSDIISSMLRRRLTVCKK